jgi:hypothetical protein
VPRLPKPAPPMRRRHTTGRVGRTTRRAAWKRSQARDTAWLRAFTTGVFTEPPGTRAHPRRSCGPRVVRRARAR